jgi:hypothetical protein
MLVIFVLSIMGVLTLVGVFFWRKRRAGRALHTTERQLLRSSASASDVTGIGNNNVSIQFWGATPNKSRSGRSRMDSTVRGIFYVLSEYFVSTSSFINLFSMTLEIKSCS